MLKRFSFLLGLTIIASYTINAQQVYPEKWKNKKYFTVVNYNVENLFDTIDTPDKIDEEFTPQSEKQWNTERYQEKLKKLATVISGINNNEFPELIGLQELENIDVLQDLASHPLIEKAGYQAVLIEGPDNRGIDCGALYRPKVFKLTDSKSITVSFDDPEAWPTRDILYLKGQVKKQTLHVFINHWSSRRGGQEKSEPKRVKAAETLKSFTDSIRNNFPDEGIIILGDFNDEPVNKSLNQVLEAGRPDEDNSMVNLMFPADDQDKGSYYYRGNYNMLDNIIVNRQLVDKNKGFRPYTDRGFIYNPDFICYTHKNGDKGPNRTYGGKNYYGGYSDHFPVFAIFFER